MNSHPPALHVPQAATTAIRSRQPSLVPTLLRAMLPPIALIALFVILLAGCTAYDSGPNQEMNPQTLQPVEVDEGHSEDYQDGHPGAPPAGSPPDDVSGTASDDTPRESERATRGDAAQELRTRDRERSGATQRTRITLSDTANPGNIAANGVLTVINQTFPIYPLDFRPADLVRVSEHYVATVAAGPLQELLDAARADDLRMRTRSGFRSFERQRENNAAVVRMLGPELALYRSARPGHSEHQSGLAVDLLPFYGHACADFYCFGDTPHARWLEANAHRFGFIVRYPDELEHITGFVWEPWHIRYIGRDAAAAMWEGGYRTLEEFLGLTSAHD